MNCRNSGRFLNEETYLNTVCKTRRRPPCKPKKRPEGNCLECSYRTPCGRLTLRCDNHSTGICIDIDNCKKF